ncbi:Transcription factor prr1 [Verticillium dahliae VDG2]|nr:Transcription factor prr1 [Verticillium dahliae VDG2]
MPNKRHRPHDDLYDASSHPKRQRIASSPPSRRSAPDLLSALSDEVAVRILSFLPIATLLDVALVSRHLSRLASDSQLWRALYYSRFVLPRALRIPGFRDGPRKSASRLHYSARRAVWADGGIGKRGGLVDVRSTGGSGPDVHADWKRQYKLRHNWARGKATVEELDVGDTSVSKKTLAKVVEGVAMTADAAAGLRAWDLKTKGLIAHVGLLDDDGGRSEPTCMAIDDQSLDKKNLDICLGFGDGSFGVWRLDLADNKFERRHRHAKSSNGALVGLAYRYPFLLTATDSVLISLYNYERRPAAKSDDPRHRRVRKLDVQYDSDEEDEEKPEDATLEDQTSLPAPILMTSLKSHTSRAPLALSIRSMAGSVVASIAYTFATLSGWSIGVQDLHVRHSRTGESEVTSTRLAYTTPVTTASGYATPPVTPSRTSESARSSGTRFSSPDIPGFASPGDGPTSLRYTHPYLLATLPDNTLILHVCTSTATALSVSPGLRLWGHTSGISDVEITARGKAVSVSSRGEEIRVWELEGRANAKSIEVRSQLQPAEDSNGGDASRDEWDDRRNWVGFDDEMVIVLKESRDGRESLMVYDFTWASPRSERPLPR